MVAAIDLGSIVFGRGGSSPPLRTQSTLGLIEFKSAFLFRFFSTSVLPVSRQSLESISGVVHIKVVG